MNVEALRDVLAGSGEPPGAQELAEVLWLLGHIAEARPESPVAAAPGPTESEPTASEDDDQFSRARPEPEPPVTALNEPERRGLSFPEEHTPESDALSHGQVREVLVSTAPMLDRELDLQRALRPLKRRIDSRRLAVLDENATAERLADLQNRNIPWLPVMRPAQERWLNLLLVIDASPSMRVWWPLGRELHETLTRTGAFRNTTAVYMDGVSIGTDPEGSRQAAETLVDPSGRQIALVLSDCSGPDWWTGAAQSALLPLARNGPLAIIQPLAERLWRRTAVPATLGQLMAPQPCASNMTFSFVSRDGTLGQDRPAVPIPILACLPSWLAGWARLVNGSGGPQRAAVSWFQPSSLSVPQISPLQHEQRLDVAERVNRFRSAASREAVVLAAHIAVSFPALPIIRLIQQQVLSETSTAHLAEVLLSGLLRPREGQSEVYDFVPGARRQLLSLLPRSEAFHTAQVLDRVSAAIEERAGRRLEVFRALAAAADGDQAADHTARPFALVSPAALRLINRTPRYEDGRRNHSSGGTNGLRNGQFGAAGELADRYRLLRRVDTSGPVGVWEALDGTANVTIKEFPAPADSEQRAVLIGRLDECVNKSRLLGDNVLRCREVIVREDRVWLVLDARMGVSVAQRMRGRRLPWQQVADIGQLLLRTLAECQKADLVHGSITPDDVLLDGQRVTLTGFENEVLAEPTQSTAFRDPARRPGEPGTAVGDLWSVATLLYLCVEGRLPFPMGERRENPAASSPQAGPLPILLQQLLRPQVELRMRLPEALRLLSSLSADSETAEPPASLPWIAMWGPPGSGKTTYLGALSVALNRSPERWRVLGADAISTETLIRTTSALMSRREFPAVTQSAGRFRWTLIGEVEVTYGRLRRRRRRLTRQIQLNLFDPPGESLRTIGQHGNRLAEVVDDFTRSRGLIYFFDPVREFELGDAFDYLNAMLVQLSSRMLGSGDFTADGRLPHYLAVCVTKFDDIRVLQSAERLKLLTTDPTDPYGFPRVMETGAEALFTALCDLSATKRGTMIRNLLSTFFAPERVRYFVTTAIGFHVRPGAVHFDPNDLVNVIRDESTGSVRIRGEVHPINVFEPLLWLGEQVGEEATEARYGGKETPG
ncbi:SAV_2336 N-terminal domain-related protein [Actinomadura nitritigenes]|uniref:SAV_2336 N-terminal domain-related protein n=1 Tax=Actinomadura nitritigenes TaxID=134602 RepID=UPI003D8BE0C5